MIRVAVIAAIATFCCAQEIVFVKNAPFTATATTVVVQTLADGNKLTKIATARISRDSEGRTRSEQNGNVFITDPTAKEAYSISANSTRRMAIQGRDREAASSPEAHTLLTRTILAGVSGNEKPIDVTVETWYSVEIQTIVKTRTIDPRVGEITWTLSDIKQAEPDRTLFLIPPAKTDAK